MLNEQLKEKVLLLLPKVQTPAAYAGGELNAVVKDHRTIRGKICMAFPDTYTLGMSHHGLQVLYSLLNRDPQWACERAFTPWSDWEALLRKNNLPLYSLETFTPLGEFDAVGFSLQYEVSYTNVLTMLDLGQIPHFNKDRNFDHPLVIAGGPGAQNPELLAPFIDLFIIGDGEESLPWVMEQWLSLKEEARQAGDMSYERRRESLAQLVSKASWAYAPDFYEPEYHSDGTIAAMHRTRPDVPREITSCTIQKDFDDIPLPTKPVVPYVQTPHDRIAIEIMRGCPHQCRFCQSTTIKRPLRMRSVETIVQAALESYRNTGTNEISLLSLSSSDYPYFEELVKRMQEVFTPLGVNVSLPSLRINHQLRTLPGLIRGVRRGGLTLAPEVARDDMREQIRKKIKNDDLYEGCREAFKNGWERVKLYFLCGLPGERPVDLDGIIEMAETIARIGKEVRGRFADVTASVSNFVPKPHTPYQWNGMQTRDYFKWAGQYLRSKVRIRSVTIKQHDIETSLLEGILTRGDRRVAPGLYEAWKRGARLDGWKEKFNPCLWWESFRDLGIDVDFYSHRQRSISEVLPWDHVNVKKGRAYLEKEQGRATIQLGVMAEAVR
ncbi:TIGR03960 family B12-binding radical SAM protein [Telmatocola sphagniphila]|uniref:TIGR03960 family B12-binding radical SAM protein n=1 Tax=Telmatocola sphagniphila TaxID=1123043 RepID=A0A8E6B8S4_9BACT|nr:TIGR03960 family B12-binding radical SAM protein [Telmatocola sphagniphila]QVL33231.1 TIGR03960 family B12-binding radical SAM protein [Telmatocola sphagniphila]